MSTRIYDQSEIISIAHTLLEYAKTIHMEGNATVVTLAGNLGAGKTTLVQQIANILGVTEVVTSPTFVVMKRYETTSSVFKSLIHIDAYRIEQEAEMVTLGFLEWLTEPETLICIEWPEKIASLVPSTALPATLTSVDTVTRKITYG